MKVNLLAETDKLFMRFTVEIGDDKNLDGKGNCPSDCASPAALVKP